MNANTVNAAAALVEVKDMYGTKFHVHAADLAGTRTMLRMHDASTGKPLTSTAHDWLTKSVHLHRGNICEHPREDFKTVTIFGDSWIECPTCRARVDAAVKATTTNSDQTSACAA